MTVSVDEMNGQISDNFGGSQLLSTAREPGLFAGSIEPMIR